MNHIGVPFSTGPRTETAPCKFDGGVGGQDGKVGVVILSGDQTLEKEQNQLQRTSEIDITQCDGSRLP